MPIDLYPRVVRCIGKPAENRSIGELHSLEGWFRMKSKLFAALPKETLLDVIQHCDFISYQENDCIIHQGEKGHRFYIILRGQVSVLHKDAFEDVDLGDEGQAKKVDRSTLGSCLVVLSEGSTFGEIALINPDCIRTASVVADERTDLVVIHRDLYNRSVSKVVAKLFQEKVDFVESLYMFADWSQKWKKAVAVSLKKETISFDSPLIKQGDPADKLFFILSGEVKMTVDPEAHYRQFDRYMNKCEVLEDHDDDIEREKAYFPQKFLPQLYKCSRINRMAEMARPGTAGEPMQLPKSWSPSAIRKMNQQINAKKIHLNLCFLGSKQCVGDVEFVLNLAHYHTSAMCTQETTVMVLTKVHFERLFKRRNPRTVKNLARVLELQLVRRSLKPNILLSVPLIKCFIYRLQEVSGERKQGEETPFFVPDFMFRVPKSHTGPRLVSPRIARDLLSGRESTASESNTANRRPPFTALSSLAPTDRPHSAAVMGEFRADQRDTPRTTTSAT